MTDSIRYQARAPPFIFVLFTQSRRKWEEAIMAQYKRIPYELVEHTEIARKSYLEYERSKDMPGEAEAEAGWITERERLYAVLNRLTPKQRQIYIMIVGYELSEYEIAERLNVTQQAVSYNYKLACRKIQKILGK